MSLFCHCYFLIFASAIFSSVPTNAHGIFPASFNVYHGSKLSSEKFQSDAYPDGRGDYVMELEIGNPPVKMYGLADTGSDLVWFQCTTCATQKCYPQRVPMYDPHQSYTYGYFTYYDPTCRKLNGYPICGNNPIPECIYNYTYGDATNSEGVLSGDTIWISQGLYEGRDFPASIQNFVFGCGYSNEGGALTENTAGIIGLNMGPLSLVTQLGIQKFSYCLPEPSSDIPGKITFGDDLRSKSDPSGVVNTPLIMRPDSYFYYVNLEGATVGGKKIQNQGNNTHNGNILIDSGTLLSLLDPGFYKSLEAAVKNTLDNLTPVDEVVPYYNLCYKEFPEEIEVVFHFTGADVTLKPMNLFLKVNDFVCFTMVPSQDSSLFIYGNTAQRNFQLTYDLANKLVSFTPTSNCAQV